MKLIVNGDDFGFTKGVTDGIVEGYQKGILRSTTALVNSLAIDYAVEQSKKNPGLGVGLHLTLTLGKSVTKNKTLTDEEGNFFPGRTTIWTKDVDYDEVYAEWHGQVERFIELFGCLPTHLDSHHSVHDATPQAYEVASRIAKEYGLQMRRYSDYKYIPNLYANNATVENYIKVLEENKDTDLEVMAHPAFCDLDLYLISSYSLGRVGELATICDLQLIKYIEENNIELCHY